MKNNINFINTILVILLIFTAGFADEKKIKADTETDKPVQAGPDTIKKLPDSRVVMYYFYGRGCRSCDKIKDEIEVIIKKYQDVLKTEKYEIWYDTKNRNMLIKMAQVLGKREDELGTPTVIIEKDIYVGNKIDIIESMIKKNLKKTPEKN